MVGNPEFSRLSLLDEPLPISIPRSEVFACSSRSIQVVNQTFNQPLRPQLGQCGFRRSFRLPASKLWGLTEPVSLQKPFLLPLLRTFLIGQEHTDYKIDPP